ncbi:hypothetical protein NUZ5A_50638 [Candidatus Nitrosotenuis uzonensis]|uniref:Uncharacterized protein n=1 Tax=Candidatus Nitrosotenuis uzonensis TaxID=1407055 RepID=A0A812F4N5_9ARCH|nr:hypothetical protein NUZ5A_50638 [Candidatus Nitrosotenuis uzonensis]
MGSILTVLPSETQVIPFFVILTFKIYLRQQTGDLSHKFNRMLTRRKMIFVEIKEKKDAECPVVSFRDSNRHHCVLV